MLGNYPVEAKNPGKKKIMWLLLLNKSPTWEKLQKRNFVYPIICPLYKQDSETSLHMFINFPFFVSVGEELHRSMGTSIHWRGEMIEATLKYCMDDPNYYNIKYIPLIIS
jgi:hypothetical protein